jgi:carbonyl reductase 1
VGALATALDRSRDALELAPDDVVHVTAAALIASGLPPPRIARPRAHVRGEVLDVGAAVTAFVVAIAARHGGVDIVSSNAAARLTPGTPRAELLAPPVDTNNLGATPTPRAFNPTLRPGGRLLVMASDFSSLRPLPAYPHERFDTDAMKLDDVETTTLARRDAVVEERAGNRAGPTGSTPRRRWGQVAAVRVLARERRSPDTQDGTLVAAVCPGLVGTEATRPWFEGMSQAQTPADAAVAPLRVARSRLAQRASMLSG